MNTKVVLLLVVLAVVAADKRPSYSPPRYDDDSYESYESDEARYNFQWSVEDEYGNDFGHEEARDGDHTQGSYYNQLPDGRLQKVTYYVKGDSGYIAEVEYEGDASYDSDSHSSEYYRPRYDDK